MDSLGAISKVGQGLTYKSGTRDEEHGGLPAGAITISKTRPNNGRGFRKGFTSPLRSDGAVVRTHELPDVYWLNLDPRVVYRPRSGATGGTPQVLVNYGRVDFLGPWRVVAYLDSTGHAVTSNFLTIRPTGHDLPVEYLWALCNSPVASAFAFCHTLKRHNTKRIMERIPIRRPLYEKEIEWSWPRAPTWTRRGNSTRVTAVTTLHFLNSNLFDRGCEYVAKTPDFR